MEFAAEEDKWNQWRFHMSAFEINGLHGNTGLFRSESDPPSLRFWLTCQMWTELGRRATIAVLWLALCSAALLGGNVCPPNVLITQSNPFPPQWGPLRLLSFFNLFQFGLFIRSTPARFTLTLSLTISLHSLPFPPSSSLRLSYHNRYRQGIRLPFNTRAERDSDQVEWF